MKKLRMLVAGSALLGATVIGGATPAMAHDGYVSLSGRGCGQVYSSHQGVQTCDTNPEGWGVRTYYRLRSGYVNNVPDYNGAAAPCGQATVGSWSNPVVALNVCAGNNGANTVCTGWYGA